MLVSPILNDLLGLLKFDPDEFLNEAMEAFEVIGDWRLGADRRACGINSVVVRRVRGFTEVDCQLSVGVWVTHFADVGSLTIKGLPDTVLTAVTGLSLRAVVDHPLLARATYAITGTRSAAGGAYVLYFAAVREELRRRGHAGRQPGKR